MPTINHSRSHEISFFTDDCFAVFFSRWRTACLLSIPDMPDAASRRSVADRQDQSLGEARCPTALVPGAPKGLLDRPSERTVPDREVPAYRAEQLGRLGRAARRRPPPIDLHQIVARIALHQGVMSLKLERQENAIRSKAQRKGISLRSIARR